MVMYTVVMTKCQPCNKVFNIIITSQFWELLISQAFSHITFATTSQKLSVQMV